MGPPTTLRLSSRPRGNAGFAMNPHCCRSGKMPAESGFPSPAVSPYALCRRHPFDAHARNRHSPAHHRRRHQALSAGTARRPPVGMVADATGDHRADAQGHGRGRGRQVRHGAGLDLLWPRQLLRRRCRRSASRSVYRGVLGGRAGARRERAHPPLGRPETHRAATVHHRQHHAGPGLLARRSEVLSGLADRQSIWASRSACKCRPRHSRR